MPARAPRLIPRRPPRMRSAALAAIFGLLVPGGGQLYVWRPGKFLVMLVAVGGLFLAGLHLTGYACVRPDTYKLEFVAQACLLGPTAAVLHLTQDVQLTSYLPHFEIGRLYVAIAGLLNVVAICDAWHHVLKDNERARHWRLILADRAARTRAGEAPSAGDADETGADLDPPVPFDTWSPPVLPSEEGRA